MKVKRRRTMISNHQRNENPIDRIILIPNVIATRKSHIDPSIVVSIEFLGMKKKRDYSDEDDDDSQDHKGKSTEPKRRGQVFAKQQDEAPPANDIKSMFAASKARTVQRQEQVDPSDFVSCFISSNEHVLESQG